MSKKLQAQIRCPKCKNRFGIEVYRSIWIEIPENRKLVFNNKINVAICPSCKLQSKLEIPLLCTNVKEHIAVWYEPYPDSDVEKDVQLYTKHYGPNSFYATAPRIREWEAFKDKIIELEQRTGMKPSPQLSIEMQEKMRGFINSLKEQQAKEGRKGIKNQVGIVGLILNLKDRIFGKKTRHI